MKMDNLFKIIPIALVKILKYHYQHHYKYHYKCSEYSEFHKCKVENPSIEIFCNAKSN